MSDNPYRNGTECPLCKVGKGCNAPPPPPDGEAA